AETLILPENDRVAHASRLSLSSGNSGSDAHRFAWTWQRRPASDVHAHAKPWAWHPWIAQLRPRVLARVLPAGQCPGSDASLREQADASEGPEAAPGRPPGIRCTGQRVDAIRSADAGGRRRRRPRRPGVAILLQRPRHHRNA